MTFMTSLVRPNLWHGEANLRGIYSFEDKRGNTAGVSLSDPSLHERDKLNFE
jgi:hypothetical protein